MTGGGYRAMPTGGGGMPGSHPIYAFLAQMGLMPPSGG